MAVSEFKAKCLGLLESLAREGKTLVLTKRGRPIARVTPVAPEGSRLRETWAGRVRIHGDLVHFDVSEDWATKE